MARITINIKGGLTKAQARALKVNVEDLTPGADIKVGNARVQVAQVQENDVRAFLRSEGIPVGSRGRISAEHQALFEAHKKAERKAKREAAAARKAEREAAQETVNA